MKRLPGQVLTIADYSSGKGDPVGRPYRVAQAFRLFFYGARCAAYMSGNARDIAYLKTGRVSGLILSLGGGGVFCFFVRVRASCKEASGPLPQLSIIRRS